MQRNVGDFVNMLKRKTRLSRWKKGPICGGAPPWEWCSNPGHACPSTRIRTQDLPRAARLPRERLDHTSRRINQDAAIIHELLYDTFFSAS